MLGTEADKGQSRNICKIRNIFLKSEKIYIQNPKKYIKSYCFLEIIVEKFIKSEKPLQILIKLLYPQILCCETQTSLQIQELSLNPGKYFANPKKYFCHVLLAPAVSQRGFPPFCRIQNGGRAVVGRSTLGVLAGMMNP